jgi:hypothetical protein
MNNGRLDGCAEYTLVRWTRSKRTRLVRRPDRLMDLRYNLARLGGTRALRFNNRVACILGERVTPHCQNQGTQHRCSNHDTFPAPIN